jgi:hypothetical protein
MNQRDGRSSNLAAHASVDGRDNPPIKFEDGHSLVGSFVLGSAVRCVNGVARKAGATGTGAIVRAAYFSTIWMVLFSV